MNTDTIRSRLLHGWSVEEALTRPVTRYGKRIGWGRQHRESMEDFRRR